MKIILIAVAVFVAFIILGFGTRYEIVRLSDTNIARVNKFTGEVCFISAGNTYATMTCDIHDVSSRK